MDNRDLERFGEEICRNVQNAIDSQDYSMLNRTIMDTVNGAADFVSHKVKHVGNAVNENIKMQQEEALRGHQKERERWQQTQQRTQQQTQQRQQQTTYHYTGMTSPSNRYASIVGHRAIGMMLAVIGGIVVLPFLLTFLMGIFLGIFAGDSEAGMVVAGSMPFVLVGGGVGILGSRMLGRAKRFQTYIRILGNREYCDVKELQNSLRKQKKYILKDLEKMMQKGWFKEGHLDESQSCFMVTDQAYQQYHELMSRMENEKREKAQEEARAKEAKEAAEKENASLPPEVRETIRVGEEYLSQIKACNDAIPGEEISAKISRIELVVDKIFDRVEQNPDTVSDLRRTMEYYLPTTVKLLKAYEELDSQPIQGENILSSKREIENTLDTLNVAFEKLLDSLFQDTAWDVSSDISVLHTMLAQEGLTEDGLNK